MTMEQLDVGTWDNTDLSKNDIHAVIKRPNLGTRDTYLKNSSDIADIQPAIMNEHSLLLRIGPSDVK